jgi:hypothetical protein
MPRAKASSSSESWHSRGLGPGSSFFNRSDRRVGVPFHSVTRSLILPSSFTGESYVIILSSLTPATSSESILGPPRTQPCARSCMAVVSASEGFYLLTRIRWPVCKLVRLAPLLRAEGNIDWDSSAYNETVHNLCDLSQCSVDALSHLTPIDRLLSI